MASNASIAKFDVRMCESTDPILILLGSAAPAASFEGANVRVLWTASDGGFTTAGPIGPTSEWHNGVVRGCFRPPSRTLSSRAVKRKRHDAGRTTQLYVLYENDPNPVKSFFHTACFQFAGPLTAPLAELVSKAPEGSPLKDLGRRVKTKLRSGGDDDFLYAQIVDASSVWSTVASQNDYVVSYDSGGFLLVRKVGNTLVYTKDTQARVEFANMLMEANEEENDEFEFGRKRSFMSMSRKEKDMPFSHEELVASFEDIVFDFEFTDTPFKNVDNKSVLFIEPLATPAGTEPDKRASIRDGEAADVLISMSTEEDTTNNEANVVCSAQPQPSPPASVGKKSKILETIMEMENELAEEKEALVQVKAALEKTNAALEKTNATLEMTNAALEKANAKLMEDLARAEKKAVESEERAVANDNRAVDNYNKAHEANKNLSAYKLKVKALECNFAAARDAADAALLACGFLA
jgi:hypothetical protein